jgi:hypothetical protein
VKTLPIVLLLLLAAGLASATSIIPMTVEQLTHTSEAVVEAQAVQQWSAWTPDHNMILTYTRFRVTSVLKGAAPAEITVKQLGGKVGDNMVKAAGVRYFRPQEEAVLFLHPAMANDGTYVITGLMQGNFHVNRAGIQPTVSNGIKSPNTYTVSPGGVSQYQGTRMTLSELETRIRKAVRP